ncbi:MAG: DUF2059 domain-containing protein [Victivallales bacterium]|nr:DUF2059 domain-containing protein [Victivallales bacterium]
MKKILFSLMVLAAFWTLVLPAQETKKYPRSSYQACYRLFEAMKMEEQFKDAQEQIELRLVEEYGEAEQEVVEDFVHRYVSYEALKEKMAENYLSYFTIEDLKKMETFYRSPTGKKWLRRQGEVESVSQLVFSTFLERQDELNQMIQETQKNQATGGGHQRRVPAI